MTISVTLSDDVFEARIVSGRQTLSSSVKISSFDSISSGTASITRSAARAASSTELANSNSAQSFVGLLLGKFAKFHAFVEIVAYFGLGPAQ